MTWACSLTLSARAWAISIILHFRATDESFPNGISQLLRGVPGDLYCNQWSFTDSETELLAPKELCMFCQANQLHHLTSVSGKAQLFRGTVDRRS